MGFTNYQAYKFKAWANVYINGAPVLLDITGGSFTFALNSIPQGSVRVALGRDTYTGTASALYGILEQLNATTVVEVWLQVRQGPNSIGSQFETWPTDAFKVFSGLVTSTGDTLSRTDVGFTINMTGWLSDLNFSSALSRSTHTLTPQALSNAATFATGNGVAWSGENSASEFVNAVTVQTDLWGRAIGPWFQNLCTRDVLTDVGLPVVPNIEAANALQRFEPFIYGGTYKYGRPLDVPLIGSDGIESISTAISEDVAQETFESIGATTLWDKLIGAFAADYRFGVVPLVDTALVVPFCPGFRFPWQTIWGQEYTAISVEDQKPRPIKGIRLFTGAGSLTGVANGRTGEADDEPSTTGGYDNPNFPTGMIIHANAPRWTANCVAPDLWGAGAAAPFDIRGGAVFPGAGAAPAAGAPADVKAAAKGLWNNYARAVYVAEALRGRTGSLQGKLRFDIAPGSTVVIQSVRDKFVTQQVGLGARTFLYAEVTAVSFGFDAEAVTAGTTFALANVRNTTEDVTDATSVDKHPFYGVRDPATDPSQVDPRQWNGAPLNENPAFVPSNSSTAKVFGALP